jgi:hypothetical protein
VIKVPKAGIVAVLTDLKARKFFKSKKDIHEQKCGYIT